MKQVGAIVSSITLRSVLPSSQPDGHDRGGGAKHYIVHGHNSIAWMSHSDPRG